MNKGTLSALKESIAHWERLSTGTERSGERVGPMDCALCRKFISQDCAGCPVAKATGKPLCRNTPYAKADRQWSDDRASEGLPQSPGFIRAAKKELAFLRSLLPRKRKP